jgi:hypothetical protein
MPKPVKKRPSSDPVTRAGQLITEHLDKLSQGKYADPPAPSFQEQLSAHMAKLGAKGGKVSGAKRMEMPAKKRREIALKAARARWSGRKDA